MFGAGESKIGGGGKKTADPSLEELLLSRNDWSSSDSSLIYAAIDDSNGRRPSLAQIIDLDDDGRLTADEYAVGSSRLSGGKPHDDFSTFKLGARLSLEAPEIAHKLGIKNVVTPGMTAAEREAERKAAYQVAWMLIEKAKGEEYEHAAATIGQAGEIFAKMGFMAEAKACQAQLIKRAEDSGHEDDAAFQRGIRALANSDIDGVKSELAKLPEDYEGRKLLSDYVETHKRFRSMSVTFASVSALVGVHKQSMHTSEQSFWGILSDRDLAAHRSLLTGLMESWEERLKSGKFNSSREILEDIWAKEGFHGRAAIAILGGHTDILAGDDDAKAVLEGSMSDAIGRAFVDHVSMEDLLGLEEKPDPVVLSAKLRTICNNTKAEGSMEAAVIARIFSQLPEYSSVGFTLSEIAEGRSNVLAGTLDTQNVMLMVGGAALAKITTAAIMSKLAPAGLEGLTLASRVGVNAAEIGVESGAFTLYNKALTEVAANQRVEWSAHAIGTEWASLALCFGFARVAQVPLGGLRKQMGKVPAFAKPGAAPEMVGGRAMPVLNLKGKAAYGAVSNVVLTTAFYTGGKVGYALDLREAPPTFFQEWFNLLQFQLGERVGNHMTGGFIDRTAFRIKMRPIIESSQRIGEALAGGEGPMADRIAHGIYMAHVNGDVDALDIVTAGRATAKGRADSVDAAISINSLLESIGARGESGRPLVFDGGDLYEVTAEARDAYVADLKARKAVGRKNAFAMPEFAVAMANAGEAKARAPGGIHPSAGSGSAGTRTRGNGVKEMPVSTMELPDAVKEGVAKFIGDPKTSMDPVSTAVLLYCIGDARGFALLKKIVGIGNASDYEAIASYAGEMGRADGLRVLELLTEDAAVRDNIDRHDHKGHIRSAIAEAAGKIGGKEGVRILERLANSSSVGVQTAVAKAAGRMGGADGLKVINSFGLQGQLSVELMTAIMWAAGEIGGEGGIKLLDSFKSSNNPDLAEEVAMSAARIGGKEGLRIIEFVRDNLGGDIGNAIAAMAAGEIGGREGIDLLLSIRSDWDGLLTRPEVMKAAGRIGGTVGWNIIINAGSVDNVANKIAMAEAVRAYGDKAGMGWLEMLSGDAVPLVRMAVAESAGRMAITDPGFSSRRVQLLEKLKGDSNANVREAVAEAAGELGGADGIRILDALKLDNDVVVREAVASAAGRIGGKEGMRILKSVDRDGGRVINVSKACMDSAGRIGGVDGLRLLLNYKNGKLGHLVSSKSMIEALKSMEIKAAIVVPPPLPPPPPHSAGRAAALIRAVVARLGKDTLGRVLGFLNRGNHPGRRADSAGFDFREWRDVEPGHPLSGRINHNKLVIRHNPFTGVDEIVGGDIHEARYDQTQAVHSMILVEPSLLDDGRNIPLENAIGTVAQLNLQNKDPVGLMIGDGSGGNFMKPGTRGGTLEHMLMKAIDYAPVSGNMSPIAMLEQGLLRRRLPKGSQVYLFSDFSGERNLEGLERVIGSYRARGVKIIPIQVGSVDVKADARKVDIGRHSFDVNPDYVMGMAESRARWRADEISDFLERNGGMKVETDDAHREPHVAAEGMIREMRSDNPDLSVGVKAIPGVEKSAVRVEETPPPPDLFDRIDAIVRGNDQEEISDLVFAAQVNGWSTVMDWVEGMISSIRDPMFGKDEFDASKAKLDDLGPYARSLNDLERLFHTKDSSDVKRRVDSHRREVEEDSYAAYVGRDMRREAVLKTYDDPDTKGAVGVFAGPWDVNAWGYTPDGLWKVLDAAHNMANSKDDAPSHRAVRPADSSHTASGESAPVIGRHEDMGIHTSGVATGSKDSGEGVIWLSLNQPLSGDGAYLALDIHGRFDPAHGAYGELPGFSLSDFTSPGDGKVKGRLVPGTPVVDVPAPLGGAISRQFLIGTSKIVEFNIPASRAADGILEMPLSELREDGTKRYGKDYDVLTEAPPLERMPDDMQEFVKGLEGKTVGEAIEAIQAFVVNNFEYRGYEDGDSRKVIFEGLKERAARGELTGPNEYLDFVIQSRKGKCAELSEVTVTLMRMAGIPAAKCRCYVAEGKKVDAQQHSVAVAVLPSAEGGWHAKRVETSVSFLSEEERAEVEAAAKVDESIEKPAAEPAAEAPKGDVKADEVRQADLVDDKPVEVGDADNTTASAELFNGVERFWEERWENASGPERAEINRMWGFYHHVLAYRGLTFMGGDAAELMLTPDQYARFRTKTVKSPAEWMEDIDALGVSRNQLVHYMKVWEGNQ